MDNFLIVVCMSSIRRDWNHRSLLKTEFLLSMVSKIEFLFENSFLYKLQFPSLLVMVVSCKKNPVSAVITDGVVRSLLSSRHVPTQRVQVLFAGINYEQQLQYVLFKQKNLAVRLIGRTTYFSGPGLKRICPLNRTTWHINING